MRLTISVIKADVGSIGGHTKPSSRMVATVEGKVAKAMCNGLLIDGNVFGKPPPEHLPRHLLFRIIAYTIQADRLGDLDAKTLKLLKQMATQESPTSAVSKDLARLDQRRFAPPPGTVLVREWGRKPHRVMVMADGYAWNGNSLDSLSQVAFAITGTKWSGPRFFGLRDRRPQFNAGESE